MPELTPPADWMDPWGPLSVAAELDDPDVKLMSDEVFRIGKAYSLLIKRFGEESNYAMPGIIDMPFLNKVLYEKILIPAASQQNVVLEKLEYMVLLDNVDVMLDYMMRKIRGQE